MQSETLSASYTQKEWKEEQVKQQRKFVKKLEKKQTVELGLYDKCYPVSDDPEDLEMKKYEEMANKATELYESGYQVKRKTTTARTAFKVVPSALSQSAKPQPKEKVASLPKPRPNSVTNSYSKNSNINKYSVDTLTTAFSSLIVAVNDNLSPKISIPPDQIKKKFEYLDGLISTPTNMSSSSFSYTNKPSLVLNPPPPIDAESSRSFDSVDKLADSFKTLINPEDNASRSESFFSTKQIPYVHPFKNHVPKPVLAPSTSNNLYNSYDSSASKSNSGNSSTISYDKFLPASKQSKQTTLINSRNTTRVPPSEPLILDAYSITIMKPKAVESKLLNSSNDSFASLEQFAKKGPKSISEQQTSDYPFSSKKFTVTTKKVSDVNIKGNTLNLNSINSPKVIDNTKLLFKKITSGNS